MPKLKLEIDALRVDSFDTHPAAGGRGTVEGLSRVIEGDAAAIPTTNDVKQCMDSWINTCVTARISDCPGTTCAYTCGDTCNQPSCITRCGATCPTGDNPICCPGA